MFVRDTRFRLKGLHTKKMKKIKVAERKNVRTIMSETAAKINGRY
jgi:hypothetical protein